MAKYAADLSKQLCPDYSNNALCCLQREADGREIYLLTAGIFVTLLSFAGTTAAQAVYQRQLKQR